MSALMPERQLVNEEVQQRWFHRWPGRRHVPEGCSDFVSLAESCDRIMSVKRQDRANVHVYFLLVSCSALLVCMYNLCILLPVFLSSSTFVSSYCRHFIFPSFFKW